jgi:hypothetical protein
MMANNSSGLESDEVILLDGNSLDKQLKVNIANLEVLRADSKNKEAIEFIGKRIDRYKQMLRRLDDKRSRETKGRDRI